MAPEEKAEIERIAVENELTTEFAEATAGHNPHTIIGAATRIVVGNMVHHGWDTVNTKLVSNGRVFNVTTVITVEQPEGNPDGRIPE